jgi:hypothetical protein
MTGQLSFADFIMYELLDQHRIHTPSILNDFSNLTAFMTRFEVQLCDAI